MFNSVTFSNFDLNNNKVDWADVALLSHMGLFDQNKSVSSSQSRSIYFYTQNF